MTAVAWRGWAAAASGLPACAGSEAVQPASMRVSSSSRAFPFMFQQQVTTNDNNQARGHHGGGGGGDDDGGGHRKRVIVLSSLAVLVLV